MRLDAAYIHYHDRVATLVAESMLMDKELSPLEYAHLRVHLYRAWVMGMTQGVEHCRSLWPNTGR